MGGAANCVIPRELNDGIGKLIGGGANPPLVDDGMVEVANIDGTTEGIPDGIDAENTSK